MEHQSSKYIIIYSVPRVELVIQRNLLIRFENNEPKMLSEEQRQQQQHETKHDKHDDEEEWDEVVDKTKIDKLKIVNLDNDMDDEMDVIIESKDSAVHVQHLDKDQDESADSSNA